MDANSHSERLFKGISIQTIITILMGIMEISLFSIMSRLLSIEDFGYFAAISGVIAITSCISEAGLGAAIIQKKDASNGYISTAFTLSCILGLLGTLLVFFFADKISLLVSDSTIIIPLKIMSIIVLLNSIISAFNAILYKNYNFKKIGLIQLFSYFISGIIGIVMALFGFRLYSIVAYNTLYLLFVSILLYFNLAIKPQLSVIRSEIKPILSYGGWLTVGTFVNNITSQVDKLCLSKWISVEALGTYNRPSGFISTITGKINAIFDTVLFPVLSDLQDDKEKIVQIFYKSTSILNSFSIVIASVFFLNSELIVRIFFGEEWLQIVPIMRILSISVIFNIDSRLVDCYFRGLNLVKIGTYIRILGLFITFILMYIGSLCGIKGVAWGFVSAYSLITVIKMAILCVTIKGNIRKMLICWTTAWKPVILILIIGALFYFFIEKSIITLIILAIIHSIIILIEFMFFPQLVSKEYCINVYPTIVVLKNRIFSWIKLK